jgi:hypothetical protein
MGLCLEVYCKPPVVEQRLGMGLSLSGQAPKKSLRLSVWRLRLSGLTRRPYTVSSFFLRS